MNKRGLENGGIHINCCRLKSTDASTKTVTQRPHPLNIIKILYKLPFETQEVNAFEG